MSLTQVRMYAYRPQQMPAYVSHSGAYVCTNEDLIAQQCNVARSRRYRRAYCGEHGDTIHVYDRLTELYSGQEPVASVARSVHMEAFALNNPLVVPV